MIIAGASPGEKMCAAVRDNGDFCTCGSNNWETVEYRRVHAARGLASTEYCLFIHATFCAIATWASPGQTKMKTGVRKNDDFLQLSFE